MHKNLQLINLWMQDGHIFANWDKESRTVIYGIFIRLRTIVQSLLTPHCTHVKNRGGVKGSVRWLYRILGKFKFVGRFDIASYYNSINHRQLLNLIKSEINNNTNITEQLKLKIHQKEKHFVGRTSNGFDFLGYQFTSGKKLRPSEISIQRFTEHARQLFERRADYDRLRLYVIRWLNYIHAGLNGIVSRKGGLKHYLVLILKKLDIKNITCLM